MGQIWKITKTYWVYSYRTQWLANLILAREDFIEIEFRAETKPINGQNFPHLRQIEITVLLSNWLEWETEFPK